MRRTILFAALVALLASSAVSALAQGTGKSTTGDSGTSATVAPRSESNLSYRGRSEDVRPFTAWITDAVIVQGLVVEPFFALNDYSGPFKGWNLGGQAGFKAAPDFETGVRWSLDRLSADNGGGSETGLSDLRGYARYRVQAKNPQVSVGASVDLPIGKEEVGAGNFNVDLFGAMRYHLDSGVVLLANAGIESVEFGGDNRDTGIHFGGGALYPLSRDLSAIGELNWGSASEYGLINGGLDYLVSGSNHLRASLGFGIDNGAPDLTLLLGFLMGID